MDAPKDYKLVVLGGGGVGKSALTIRLVTDNFLEEYDPTIEDSYRKSVMIDDESCLLDILDTAGQEEFSSMQDQWMREGDAFLIVYSITERSSFDEAIIMREKILRCKDDDEIPIVLCANKCDLEDQRQVQDSEGEELVKGWGDTAAFYQTSAKEKINNEICFYQAVRLIRKQQAKSSQNNVKKERKTVGCHIL